MAEGNNPTGMYLSAPQGLHAYGGGMPFQSPDLGQSLAGMNGMQGMQGMHGMGANSAWPQARMFGRWPRPMFGRRQLPPGGAIGGMGRGMGAPGGDQTAQWPRMFGPMPGMGM